MNLSKTQLHKIGQSQGFLGILWRLLLKTRLPLMKNILTPLAKSLLVPLRLTAAAAVTDSAIFKKMFRFGRPSDLASRNRTLKVLNKEINDIIKIAESFEESGLLIKGVSETIENEEKKKKGGFFGILLGTLGASLLGDLLAGKGCR